MIIVLKPHATEAEVAQVIRKIESFGLAAHISKGTERELFFIQSLQDAGIELFYSSDGDFQTRHEVFEVGGKNKTRRQLKDAKKPSYLVKDDILTPLKGELPLFMSGFIL